MRDIFLCPCFEQTEPAGGGKREQAAGFNSRCQPHPTTAEMPVGSRGEICDGRQAGRQGIQRSQGNLLPYLVSGANPHG